MEFEEDQLKWQDVIFGFAILFVIIILIVGGFQLISLWNFNTLTDLNNKTCKLANIPENQCFCEMDIWGNVMCSMKQQSSSVTISQTIIRSK